jgi:hypothetical protein
MTLTQYGYSRHELRPALWTNETQNREMHRE